MYRYTAYFKQIKERDGVKVWESDEKELSILARSDIEVQQILKAKFGEVDIGVIDRDRFEIQHISKSITDEINLRTLPEYAKKVNQHRKKEDLPTNDGYLKPQNVEHVEEKAKKYKWFNPRGK